MTGKEENNMTQEEKDLLLKDLCARLPYGVKLYIEDFVCTPRTLKTVFKDGRVTCVDVCRDIEKIKPCLFPLSNLTEKQRSEISKLIIDVENDYPPYGEINTKGCDNLFVCCAKQSVVFMEYCYIHHLDVNGLIEKGLAIDATELNIY